MEEIGDQVLEVEKDERKSRYQWELRETRHYREMVETIRKQCFEVLRDVEERIDEWLGEIVWLETQQGRNNIQWGDRGLPSSIELREVMLSSPWMKRGVSDLEKRGGAEDLLRTLEIDGQEGRWPQLMLQGSLIDQVKVMIMSGIGEWREGEMEPIWQKVREGQTPDTGQLSHERVSMFHQGVTQLEEDEARRVRQWIHARGQSGLYCLTQIYNLANEDPIRRQKGNVIRKQKRKDH